MTWVLDSSAVLSLVNDEDGADEVESMVRGGATISPVNMTEVSIVLQRAGWPKRHVEQLVSELDLLVLPVDRALSQRAASFEAAARAHGLSLGDRYCLATASLLDAPAVTADAAWDQVTRSGLPVEVLMIR